MGRTLDRRQSCRVHGVVSERWWNKYCFSPSLFAAFIHLYHTLFAAFFLLLFQCSHFTLPFFFTLLCIPNKYASSLASLGWLEAGWLGLARFAFSHLKFVFYGVFVFLSLLMTFGVHIFGRFGFFFFLS